MAKRQPGPRANPSKAGERRQKFFQLRRQGLDQWDAATAVGIDPTRSAARYEHWFQAAEAAKENPDA